jgi:hypothetical protein
MASLRIVAVVAFVAGATVAVACGGSSTASNACEPNCDENSPTRKKPDPGDDDLGTPTVAEDPPTNLPEGGDAPSGDAGAQCTALAACCVEIKTSGADPSTCEGAVAKKDESACTKAHDGYKTFGPCTPPGVQCTKLSGCCIQIKTSGADSSVCEAAAKKKDETACQNAYDGYKTFGPCT